MAYLGQGQKMAQVSGPSMAPLKCSGQNWGLLSTPSCGRSQPVLSLPGQRGCPKETPTFFYKANILIQTGLFSKAPGKSRRVLDSKQVLTDVCRRCRGHTLWKTPGSSQALWDTISRLPINIRTNPGDSQHGSQRAPQHFRVLC